ncbi:hypothetical protein D1872_320020 [compost metagenome]
MNQPVQYPEFRTQRVGQFIDILVDRYVAGQDKRIRYAFRQLAHPSFHAFALICKGEASPLLRQALGDRPGNAAVIGHAHDDDIFSRQQFSHE